MKNLIFSSSSVAVSARAAGSAFAGGFVRSSFRSFSGQVFVACFSSQKIALRFSKVWSHRLPVSCGCVVRRLSAVSWGVSVPVAPLVLALPVVPACRLNWAVWGELC